MADINKNIFRRYDIRGKVSDEELNERTMELLGKAAGTYYANNGIEKAVCGSDSRTSSESFREAAIKGLSSAGISVVDLGMVLTPMTYWAQYYFDTSGGLMITASHNPRGWNGLKVAKGASSVLGGEELLGLCDIIQNETFVDGTGDIESVNIKDAYIEDLLSRVNLEKKFKVVLNTGNGTAGPFATPLLQAAGCDVVEHNTEVDPEYPNYIPNPSRAEMMEDTGRVVREEGADLGIAIDADGDRLGITDERGEIVWPDTYLIFLARSVLREKPGSKILFDVKSSRALEEDIKANGGEPHMVPTGHAIVKQKMAELGSPLAGEVSGHVYLKHRFYGHDDALFGAVFLLEHLSKQDKSLSELVKTTPHYETSPTYTVSVPDDKKFDIVSELTEEFTEEGYKVVKIDGARVEAEKGWGLVRASNTGPHLTLRFEGKTKEYLEEIQGVFKEKLSKYESVGEEWVISG